jgi:rRNA maturation endonuclease Nob1
MPDRTEDTTKVECMDCKWEGQAKDCIHDYGRTYPDSVEPVDYCPNCGSQALVPLDEEGKINAFPL